MLRLSIILGALIVMVNGAPLTRGNLLLGAVGDGINGKIGNRTKTLLIFSKGLAGRSDEIYILEVNPITGDIVQTFQPGSVKLIKDFLNLPLIFLKYLF